MTEQGMREQGMTEQGMTEQVHLSDQTQNFHWYL